MKDSGKHYQGHHTGPNHSHPPQELAQHRCPRQTQVPRSQEAQEVTEGDQCPGHRQEACQGTASWKKKKKTQHKHEVRISERFITFYKTF